MPAINTRGRTVARGGIAAALLGAATMVCGLGLPGAAAAMDIANGNRVYNTYCIGCHGIGGRAVMPQAPSFGGGGNERLMQPDFVLAQTIKTGKNAMPPFLGILKDQEIIDVLFYLRTLR